MYIYICIFYIYMYFIYIYMYYMYIYMYFIYIYMYMYYIYTYVYIILYKCILYYIIICIYNYIYIYTIHIVDIWQHSKHRPEQSRTWNLPQSSHLHRCCASKVTRNRKAWCAWTEEEILCCNALINAVLTCQGHADWWFEILNLAH